MPLLKKPHGQLTWDDVRGLIAQEVPENELLDYKRQLPNHIENTIAAMANTYGGDILVGVAQRSADDGRPQPIDEVRGVARPGAVKQSIEQKNFNIHPPVLGMDVQAVTIPPSEDLQAPDDAAVVVVRIPQSDLAPHFVVGQGHFHRAGSHGRPYRDEHLATERIRWLDDRRERHTSFREELLGWMDWLAGSVAWHKAWCIPLFPLEAQKLHESDCDQADALLPTVGFGTGTQEFFRFDFAPPFATRSIQHGWLCRGQLDDHVAVDRDNAPGVRWIRPFFAYYVDDWGLVGLKSLHKTEALSKTKPLGTSDLAAQAIVFDWTVVATHLMGVARHACALYQAAGYTGPVEFGVELGLAADVEPLPLYLGISRSPRERRSTTGSDTRMWIWGADIAHLSDEPMTARERRLREAHHALAQDLLDEVRAALIESRWTRAFDHRMRHEDSASYVASLEKAFSAP